LRHRTIVKKNRMTDVSDTAKTNAPPPRKQTTPALTKYERARILGTRALQLSMGAPALVDIGNSTNPLEIAARELDQCNIPMIIRRYFPNDDYEDRTLDELVHAQAPRGASTKSK
jgi:DNA-directed RNA polymerase subunit K/omega